MFHKLNLLKTYYLSTILFFLTLNPPIHSNPIYQNKIIYNYNYLISLKLNKFSNINSKWITFGPLKIYLEKVVTNDKYILLPALNPSNKPIYLSINCLNNSINTTGRDFEWKEWKEPIFDFERKLISFSCELKNKE